MCFAQEKHQGAGLADAAADGEREHVVDDSLVVGEFEMVEQVGHLELLAQSFGVDADAHGTQLVAALGDVVPDQNVAVETVGIAVGLIASVGNPVVVVGGAHFMRVAVFEWPADTDDEDGRVFLENHSFPAFARQVGIHGEQLFGVQERKLFWQIGVARIAEFGEHFLCEFFGADEDFPDFAHDRLQKLQIALLSGDSSLPIPLIDIGGMIVIEEVVFADSAHVGAEAFAGAAVELLEGDALPLGGGLNNLGLNVGFLSRSFEMWN